ncbi:hypothetical protein AMJ80_08290 [bacterium SM23_31]|nr:MAG: hypothetical protein AMJ80_08290 [bacterium SM23_31]
MRLLKNITIFGLLLFILQSQAHGQDIKTVRDFGYAVSLYDKGLYIVAVDAFKNFQFNNPDDPRNAEAQSYIGKSYMALEEYENARAAFEEFALLYRESPLYPDVYRLLAECCERLGEPETAAQRLEALGDILFAESRHAVPALYRAAEIYITIGKTEKAYNLLSRLIDNYPEHQLYPKAVILLSNLYAENGEYGKAIRELRKIEDSGVENTVKWEAAYFRGIYELKVNKVTSGEKTLQSILTGAPSDSSIYQKAVLVLARHYQAVNKHDEAQRVLERLINVGRANPHLKGQAYMLLGINHHLRSNYKEAEKAFQQALEILDNTSSAYRECLYYTGLNYTKLEDNRQAFSFLSRMFSQEWLDTLDGRAAAPYEFEALRLYFRTANLTNASVDITLYSKAILEKSGMFADAEMFLRWGDLFLESSVPRTAKALYEKGISKFPGSRGSDFLFLDLGKTNELLGEYLTASGSYEKVRNNFPGGEVAHLAEERADYITRKFSTLSQEEIIQKRSQFFSQLEQILTGQRTPEQIQNEAFIQGKHYFDIREIDRALKSFSTIIEAGAAGQYYTDALKYAAQLHDDLFHIYSFEGDPIMAEREGRAALNYYTMFLEQSGSADFSDTARRRAFDLTLELTENPDEKIQQARILVQSLQNQRYEDAADYGQYKLAKLIIKYENSVAAVSDAVNLLGRLEMESFDKPIQEDILYLQVAAGQKLLDNTRIIQSCSRYMSDYSRGSHAPEVRYCGAKALFNTGDAATAKMWTDQLRSDFYYSDYADSAYVLLADILLKEGNTEEALTLYRRAIRSVSEYEKPGFLALLLWKTGDAYAQKRDFTGAADHYGMYIAAAGDINKKSKGYSALAKAYASQDSLDAAINAYHEIISLNPDSAQTFNAEVEIAYLLLQLASSPVDINLDEKLRRARQAFLEIARKPLPDTTRARLEYSALLCLYNLDRREEANNERSDFEKKYRNLPDELMDDYKSLLRVEEGAVHQRTGMKLLQTADQKEADNRLKDAENIFKDVIEKYPGSKAQQLAEFYWGLQMAVFQNRLDEGMPLLTNFHRKYPDSPYLYNVYKQLGTYEMNLEWYRDAYVSFSRAIETPKGRNDRKLHSDFIKMCIYIGDNTMAIDAIRDYLQHFPNAPDRMEKQILIGTLYSELKEYDAAFYHLKSILPSANPDDQIIIQYNIGLNLYEQKKFTLAIAELLKLIEYSSPSSFIETSYHTQAKWYIGKSFKEIGQYENALHYIDELLNTIPSNDPRHQEARKEKEYILELMKIKK